MIIKKIILNNIRSYKNEEIIFPEGSILLSGDIGSGKTSILLGIEFALFGLQPGQKGASLLKNGETEGGVILDFEIDERKISIERNLKKGKTITQNYCSITVDEKKSELSVTEIKDRVLDLLNYPKEFIKKQNILYKFTVYTPQEEMKQIILEDVDVRLNALRHVFGVDKYKRILENSLILISKLREERRINEVLVMDVEKNKMILKEKTFFLEEKRKELEEIKKEFIFKKQEKEKIQEKINNILKDIDERRNLQKEVEKTKIMLLNKKEIFSENLKIIENLKKFIEETKNFKFDEKEIGKVDLEIISLKKKLGELNEENLRIIKKINSFEIKNKENESIKDRLSRLEECPTCLQNVEISYKTNLILKIDSNILENNKKINIFSDEEEKIKKEILEISLKISSNELRIREIHSLKIKFIDLSEKIKRKEELEKTNDSLNKDIILLDNHIEGLSKSIFDMNKFENIFESLKKEMEVCLNQEKIIEIKEAELKKEIEFFLKEIQEINKKIKEAEEIKLKLNHISCLEKWILESFTPMVSIIEKNIMIKLKHEFSRLFSNWFSMLVSETFDAQLDDNFTPLIGYQDYEIDYSYLSGGERTAIALAYRLALNQVLNSLLSEIKTKDIVILDEPTDGFSEQQIDKMRDVFYQLDAKQIIIVSHEQKIGSFVENVIKLKKENSFSKIKQDKD